MSWMIHTAISTSLLLLLVLAIRGPVARHFGARTAYALWALPALRAILPPVPGWTSLYEPVFSLGGTTPQVGLTDPVTAAALPVGLTPDLAQALPAVPAAIDGMSLLLCAWGGVALLWFGWQMLRYHGFLRAALRPATFLTRECGIDVWVSPHVDGPVAAGLLRRRIFLPADFLSRYTAEERRLALVHEGAHHDRLDIAANLFGLGVVALHWWNPIAHWAYRAFRTDQELACDATVLARATGAERAAYGAAVLKSACRRTPAAACALNHRQHIRQRIRMMAPAPRSFGRLLAGATLTLAAIGGGLVVTASGAAVVQPPEAPAIPAMPAMPTLRTPPAIPAVPAVPDATEHHADRAEHRADAAARRADDKARIAARRAAEAGRLAAIAGRRAAEAGRAAAFAAREAHAWAPVAVPAVPEAPLPPAPPAVPRSAYGAEAAAQADAAIAASRARMAARCRQQGVTMPADADFPALATCGGAMQRMIRTSLQHARQSIRIERNLTDDQRRHALEGIDRALADVQAEVH